MATDRTKERCAIVLANLRVIIDEAEELLSDPAQTDHGAVMDQLRYCEGKLEIAVGYAAHGAGKVVATAPLMPSTADLTADLLKEIGWSKPERPRKGRREGRLKAPSKAAA